MSHFDLDESAPKHVELGSTVNVGRQSPGKRRLSYYPGHRTTGKVQMKLGGRNAAAATGALNSPVRKDKLVNNDYTAAKPSPEGSGSFDRSRASISQDLEELKSM